MKILLVVAEAQEAKPLIEYYKLKPRTYYKPGGSKIVIVDVWTNHQEDIMLITTGAGVNNVISSLSNAMYAGILNAFTNIINVGYAGAKYITIGEVACVKEAKCFEFPIKADTQVRNHIRLSEEGYDCYTSFDFVEKADNIPGPVLFDMELAYIARFPYKSLYSIKIVSDNLDYNGFKSFTDEESWKIVINAIEERRG